MNKGFTLVEVLISGLILIVSAYFAIQGLSIIGTEEIRVDERMALNNTVESLVNTINSNLAFEKIETINVEDASLDSLVNWNDVETLNQNLPYAWDRLDPIHEVAALNERSAGRIGYTIVPVLNAIGLLEVRIKVTHPKLFPVDDPEIQGYKEYRFLVNSI